MSMKKRLADIVTRFRVDGARQAGAEMQSVSAAAAKASKATDGLSGTGAAQIAGAAGAAAGQLDEVRESALAAKKAIAEIGSVKVNGRGLDLGIRASGKDASASASVFASELDAIDKRVRDQEAARAAGIEKARRAAAATSLRGIDTSAIAPDVDAGTLEKALKRFRESAADGVQIGFYVDPQSLVRIEHDVLKKLDDITPTVDFSNVDKGALKRAGAAMTKALASGMKLDQFVDAQTKVAFNAEQLKELARTGFGAGEALEDVADEAKKADRAIKKIDDRPIRDVRQETLASNRGFRTLRSGAEATVRSLRSVGSAGAAMGVTLSTALQKSTGLLKGLAAGAAGLAASKGLTIGGAGAFGIQTANGQVERYKTVRNISALTGMSPQETEFWERFGANVGLEGTDLGQVFSGFVAARRDVEKDPESDVGKIFADLKLGQSAPRTMGLDGLLPTGLDEDGKPKKSRVASMFSGIYGEAEKATNAVQGTNAAFVELLLSLRGLDPQKRAGYLTQIFGEDDALKVAELAQMVGQQGGIGGALGQMAARGDLISNQQLAQVRRFQIASLQLSNTWDGFKRRLFSAIEPLLTRYAGAFEILIRGVGPGVIESVFVRPLQSGHRTVVALAKGFKRLRDSTNGFRAIRGQFANTLEVLKTLGVVAYELAWLFSVGFLPKPGAAEAAYVTFLNAVMYRLEIMRGWIRIDGPDFVRWVKASIAVLAQLAIAVGAIATGIARGIDEALAARGIDWRQLLSPENLAREAKGAALFLAAFFRDLRKIFTGSDVRLETGLAKWLVEAFEYAREKVGDLVVGIRTGFEKAIAGVQARVESFVAYLKTSFSEFQSAMSGGLAIEDMSTRLGQLMAILGNVVDYLVRLGQAIRQVVVEGRKAPQGFEWLETVTGIATRLGNAIGNIFEAIKKITQPIDAILQKMGLWDTATIALAGLIVSKIAFAFGTTVVGAIGAAISAAKTLMGILGFGSAGGAAAGAATAASGAAAAGATGGILAGVTAIGVALGQVLLRFTPIVGALAGITAGFYGILSAADRLMPFIDRVGGWLGLKTKADVETDVAAIRAQMTADYARRGGVTGKSPLAASPSDGVMRQYDVMPTTAEWNRIAAKNGWNSDRPTNVVNLTIEGLPRPVTLSGTDSQVAELQRMRARRLG